MLYDGLLQANILMVCLLCFLQVSAKMGIGIEEVLRAIVEKIPPPTCDTNKPLKALVFDSWYDKYKGTICLMSLKDGIIQKYK